MFFVRLYLHAVSCSSFAIILSSYEIYVSLLICSLIDVVSELAYFSCFFFSPQISLLSSLLFWFKFIAFCMCGLIQSPIQNTSKSPAISLPMAQMQGI